MGKYTQITEWERYQIAILRKEGFNITQIAKRLGRHRSSISREMRRNTNWKGVWTPSKAQEKAQARRWKSRKKPQFTQQEFQIVIKLLKLKWSPEQISNVLKGFGILSISHETIYKYIWRNKHKENGNWWVYLRHNQKQRRKRNNSQDSRGRLSCKRPIENRPQGALNRSRPGHFEIDTVWGKGSQDSILTLVDRKTGYTIIGKLKNRSTKVLNRRLLKLVKRYKGRIKTITADNGTEFHAYKKVEQATGIKWYFAKPYHSWERGTNENTNGLIRQWLPKGTSMSSLTQRQCDSIATQLNHRPRKRLGYTTPYSEFHGVPFCCTSKLISG